MLLEPSIASAWPLSLSLNLHLNLNLDLDLDLAARNRWVSGRTTTPARDTSIVHVQHEADAMVDREVDVEQ
jgi:hypothetical protein